MNLFVPNGTDSPSLGVALVTRAPHALITSPHPFRYLDVNDTFARLLGLLPEQLIGRPVCNEFHLSEWNNRLELVAQTGHEQQWQQNLLDRTYLSITVSRLADQLLISQAKYSNP